MCVYVRIQTHTLIRVDILPPTHSPPTHTHIVPTHISIRFFSLYIYIYIYIYIPTYLSRPTCQGVCPCYVMGTTSHTQTEHVP